MAWNGMDALYHHADAVDWLIDWLMVCCTALLFAPRSPCCFFMLAIPAPQDLYLFFAPYIYRTTHSLTLTLRYYFIYYFILFFCYYCYPTGYGQSYKFRFKSTVWWI